MSGEGRVALVTGGSRGIGRAIVLQLASQGIKIAVNYHVHAEEASRVVNTVVERGGEAIALQADVSKAEEVEAMFQHLHEKWPAVDILVNNAGITKDALLVRMSEETWDAVVNTNLRGVFLCTRASLRTMMRNRWGRIINIGSIVGPAGNAGQANYAASKAGLIGFTRSVAKEVATRNITVNCVNPGYVATDIVEGLPPKTKEWFLEHIPLHRFGRAEEVASLVGYLASEAAAYITGQVITVDGGLAQG
ncbi:MAG: 3-oxoacyl-[acyl-carrier-protein] reductase [Chloroflexi bacterium]|nr:3-oxoacyl-[acyl-carrier-protein] reductase [Chloroflexota bacterium]